MTEVELQPQTNGIEAGEDDSTAVRPADIEAVCIQQFLHFVLFISVCLSACACVCLFIYFFFSLICIVAVVVSDQDDIFMSELQNNNKKETRF